MGMFRFILLSVAVSYQDAMKNNPTSLHNKYRILLPLTGQVSRVSIPISVKR